MRDTARRAFVVAVVVGAVVVAALALWELKVLLLLLFLALVIAAAMRPGVDALARRRVPRGVGVLLHYAVLAGGVALFLWLVVPTARDQLAAAVPTSRAELKSQAAKSTGIKHDILVAIQKRVNRLPSANKVVHPAVAIGVRAFEILIDIFFTFAAAAYWIFERDRVVGFVSGLFPDPKRKLVRDTWTLIDLKLGAYVRGQGLLVVFVAIVLSSSFWLIGLPFWLLIGVFAGIVELIPVVGPLTAGVVAVGVGLTSSVGVAAAAAVVLGVRLLEDYIVVPRVLGEAVGLSPLLVLVSVFSTTILFGGAAVLLAIPLAAVVGTIVQVVVLRQEPGEQEVPAVLFAAKDAEG